MLMLIPNRSRSNRILWLTSCHACLNTMLESSFSPGNQILHLGTSNPSSSRRFTCYLTTTTGNLCYRVQRNISIGIAFFIINLLPRGMYVAKETRKVYITTCINILCGASSWNFDLQNNLWNNKLFNNSPFPILDEISTNLVRPIFLNCRYNILRVYIYNWMKNVARRRKMGNRIP